MQRTFLPGIRDDEALDALSETIVGVLDQWGIQDPERHQLLGTEQCSESDSARLINEPGMLERVGHLLAIDRALGKEDSATHRLAAWWMRTPHPALSGKSPLEVMLSEGVRGMKTVRAILEHGESSEI